MHEKPLQAESEMTLREAIEEITLTSLTTLLAQDVERHQDPQYQKEWEEVKKAFPFFTSQILAIQTRLEKGYEREKTLAKKDIIEVDQALLPFGSLETITFLRRLTLGEETPSDIFFKNIHSLKEVFGLTSYRRDVSVGIPTIIEAVLTDKITFQPQQNNAT